MKLSTKIFLPIILISALLILLVGCFPTINQAPIITSTPITLAEVDGLYTYDVNATDPDGDTLTYSLDVKPIGMTIDSATGVISWTPTTAQIGSESVTVKVSDGALDITQSFTIVVSAAAAPGLAPTPEPEPEYGPGPAYVPTPTVYYDLTMAVSPGGSGTTTPSVGTHPYSAGTIVDIEAFANQCCVFDHWSGALTGDTNPYYILMDADKAVTANFVKKTYTITASADSGGSISPSGAVTVDEGTDKTFTIAPDSIFYEIDDVLVDGNSVGPESSYTFTNVTKDHTIEASFTLLGRVYNQDQQIYYNTLSQLVIDEADPGDTILVSPWIYKLVPVDDIGICINKDNLTLKAVGATEDTIIDFSLCDLAIRIINVDGATVEGFTMEGGGSGHQAFQVIGSETNPVSNVNILNNVITGSTDSAINLYGAWGTGTGITISGNTIDNCQYGIMAGAGANHCTISNNKITNSVQDDSNWGAIAFFGTISDFTISGNEISSNEKLNGIVLGYGGTTLTNILVENNTIFNNLGGVLIGDVTIFTNLVINYNNIEGNTTGVLNKSALLLYAEANWWGDETGPSGVGPGTGDTVSTNVDYIPWSTSQY